MFRRFLVSMTVVAALASVSPALAGGAPGDIRFKRDGDTAGFPPAYFPHWVHRIQFRCYVCHDEIFAMKGRKEPITMEPMSQGKWCGACHNGKIAWAVDECQRCHVGE